jgi:putative hydrolase of the HAD superfamily
MATASIRHILFDADGVLQALGYDELFDVSCYSFELGVAKPHRGFFERAVARIGVPAGEVLFIDDLVDNVASAREAGMRAEQWTLDDGHPVLLERLAAHGVAVTIAR